tara:strand:- start:302 stop:1063 length:762 start_codon:yes stop_codon:yes gene_type:complete
MKYLKNYLKNITQVINNHLRHEISDEVYIEENEPSAEDMKMHLNEPEEDTKRERAHLMTSSNVPEIWKEMAIREEELSLYKGTDYIWVECGSTGYFQYKETTLEKKLRNEIKKLRNEMHWEKDIRSMGFSGLSRRVNELENALNSHAMSQNGFNEDLNDWINEQNDLSNDISRLHNQNQVFKDQLNNNLNHFSKKMNKSLTDLYKLKSNDSVPRREYTNKYKILDAKLDSTREYLLDKIHWATNLNGQPRRKK